MRVLVVEDDAALREQITGALVAGGHAVDSAANGIDGAHLGRVEAFDAVVLDLGLPGCDGLAVLQGRTTTLPSPSRWKSCWRACAR